MKPLFVKRSGVWFIILFVGIAFVGVGLWTAPQSSDLKGAGGSGAPAADLQVTQRVPDGGEVAANQTLHKGNINGYQNTLSDDNIRGNKSAKQDEFFVEYRLERDRTRSQQIDLYREIINNQNSPEETRKEAQRRFLGISQAIDIEMKLENLIKAEDFKDAVVLLQDKSVTVIVETPVLTPMDKERLTGIAVRATGFSENNVVIIAKV